MLQAAQAEGVQVRALVSADAHNDAAILAALEAFSPEGLSTRDVMTLIDKPRTTVSAHICNLVKRGFVVPTGEVEAIPTGGTRPHYRLAPPAVLASLSTGARQ